MDSPANPSPARANCCNSNPTARGIAPSRTEDHDVATVPKTDASRHARGWRGHRGRVTGSLTGTFPRLGQAWTLVESAGQLVLRDLDTSKYPAEPADQAPASTGESTMAILKRLPADAGATIDVLVLHTPNAQQQAGGRGPMEDLIRGSLVDLEIALANSEAGRIRINHLMILGPDGPLESAAVAYDESPNISSVQQRWFAHRRWARTNAQAVDLRNQYQADLVVMLVGDTGTCGVAYTQRPDCGFQSGEPNLCTVGAGYSEFAVSVVGTRPACGLPTRTMAHEMGHQFGMEHNPPNGSAVGAASFPWSYGFTRSTATVQARTIMAYEIKSGANANCPNGCPIQLHYSNPQVEFQAFPGVPTGTLAGDAHGRHSVNARTAVLYAPAMERFRGPIKADKGIFGHGFESLPDIVCNPAIWANCPQ